MEQGCPHQIVAEWPAGQQVRMFLFSVWLSFLLLGHSFFRHFSESPRDGFLETTRVAGVDGERDRERVQTQNTGRGEEGLSQSSRVQNLSNSTKKPNTVLGHLETNNLQTAEPRGSWRTSTCR